MLAEVDIAPSMKFYNRPEAAPPADNRATFIIEVNDRCAREIIDFPPGIPDAFAVIRIDMVGQPLVKMANLLDYLPTDHHGSTGNVPG